ncbi:Hint domain-containing protein [Rhodovulum imhoffii]|uniref:Hint domain-containing protein n=1 Tax=Rhodovulum imhoffii TaxID=365340 RepID=A0A2T5BNU8_9RHOB|nr:Hint domain-containing protein [Rhodovulum imhoffii]PTN00684.1 Hint domain-containing protein [Rhodovulum imhoffii]
MKPITLYQDASLSGSGAKELANTSKGDAVSISAGDTIAFNGNTTDVVLDMSLLFTDSSVRPTRIHPIGAPGMVNGTAVDSGTDVGSGFILIAEDRATKDWYRIDILSFGASHNKAYRLSHAWDPVSRGWVEPKTAYAGQVLTVLGAEDISAGISRSGAAIALTDPGLHSFAVGGVPRAEAPETDKAEPAQTAPGLVSFAGGTRIETPYGPCNVENLRTGDIVCTVDRGNQEVLWVGSRTCRKEQIARNPKFAPVRIRRGALGCGLPLRDLRVGQLHRVLVRNAFTQRIFEKDEVLVTAGHLCGLEGIEIETDAEAVTFYHFLCAQHEIVLAEGAQTESLYLEAPIRPVLSAAEIEEIDRNFPVFGAQLSGAVCALPVRALSNARKSRKMVAGLSKENRPALEGAGAVTLPKPCADRAGRFSRATSLAVE